jgi:hypothetical protein
VEWGAGEEVEKRLGALIGEEGERARRRMRREIGFTAGKPCRDEKDVMVKGEGGDGGGSPSVELEGIREAYNLRVGMECARRMGVCPGGGGGGNVGKSADDLMIDWSRKGWVGGCVHAALHLGANPCIADAKGDTAMHLAAGQGHPETCHAIIEVGGDANAVNSEGLSPRLLAEKRVRNHPQTLDPKPYTGREEARNYPQSVRATYAFMRFSSTSTTKQVSRHSRFMV